MKGIIASAFADLAKIGESGAFVLPQSDPSRMSKKTVGILLIRFNFLP